MNWTCLTTVFSLALALMAIGCAPALAESTDSPKTSISTRKTETDNHPSALAYKHYLKARLLMSKGRLRQSVDEIRHALLYDHSSAYLHVVLGGLYAGQGLWKKADKEASKALALNESHIDALLLKGQAAIHVGNFDQAIDLFQKVITLGPKALQPMRVW